ncbi:MAG: hypothetical protein M5U26_20915 [Planctomycetota bacterium]|nr:hypothetical protein [Planctomycetota bacterium]
MPAPQHYLRKRDLLWDPRSSPQTLSGVAREFMAQERYSDALDFYQHAKDEQGIAEIKRIALEQGDSFLLSRLSRFDRTLVTEDDWKRVESAAMKRNSPSMAAFAHKQYAQPEEEVAKKEDRGEKPLDEL